MIARNAITTLLKLRQSLSFMVTVGGMQIEFIEESIFGFKYQMAWQGELKNFYLDEQLKIDTMNLVCREISDKDIFVLEQVKGKIPPQITQKINRYEGERRWSYC